MGTGALAPYARQSDPDKSNSNQDWQRQLRNRESSFLTKSVAGSVDVTLTTDETNNKIIEFTGAIGANINVNVAVVTRSWIIFNGTSGAFTLTVKTPSGTGIAVGQGKRCILYCNGINVVRATADV